MTTQLPAARICVAAFVLIGCSPIGVSVEGSVTLDGEPVNGGMVVFVPVAAGEKKVGAMVHDGRFVIKPIDGLRPGPYTVEVSWLKPTGRQVMSADPPHLTEEVKEAIPAKFNSESTLTSELAPGANVRDFQLQSR